MAGLPRVLKVLAILLICKVTLGVVLGYRDYLPPDFAASFLLGRENYFWRDYHWAFYAHILTGPCTLMLGLILMNERMRRKLPQWHRRLGKVQGVLVLFLVVPTGLWMACYAANGPLAGLGFGLLAIATGITVTLGWKAAVQRRFETHRRWMERCFVLLCSAVIVRLNGGLGSLAGISEAWYYVQIAWTSWLVPLAALEIARTAKRKGRSVLRTVSARA